MFLIHVDIRDSCASHESPLSFRFMSFWECMIFTYGIILVVEEKEQNFEWNMPKKTIFCVNNAQNEKVFAI